MCFTTRERVVTEWFENDGPENARTKPSGTLQQIAAPLFVGVAGGVAAVAVLVSMVLAFKSAPYFQRCSKSARQAADKN